MTTHTERVRTFLRAAPDGATTSVISANIGISQVHVRSVLIRMPDSYIDRWQSTGKAGALAAVWAVVVPPPDCPHPNGRELAR